MKVDTKLKESRENKNLKEILSEKFINFHLSYHVCLKQKLITSIWLTEFVYFHLHVRLINAVYIYLEIHLHIYIYINITNLSYRNSSNLIDIKVFLLTLNVKLAPEKLNRNYRRNNKERASFYPYISREIIRMCNSVNMGSICFN